MSLIRPMRIMGLKVDFHWSILILMFLIVRNLTPYLAAKNPNVGMIAIGMSCLVVSIAFIISILAHELAHVWAGRKFGIGFRGITLFVFGGAARMTHQPDTPKAECLMALAGPVCSMVIAIVMFGLSIGCAFLFGGDYGRLIGQSIMMISVVNGMLGVFNMIPAFPLDGGRVARAGIWKATGSFAVATRYATYGGMGLGGFFMAMGLIMAFGYQTCLGHGIGDGLWIGIIGFLVVLMAKAERRNVLRMGYRP